MNLWISYVDFVCVFNNWHGVFYLPPEVHQKLNKLGKGEFSGDVQVLASSMCRVVDGLSDHMVYQQLTTALFSILQLTLFPLW